MKTKSQTNRELHYKQKLQYKLIRGGERVDISIYRKHLHLSKTLTGIMWANEDWFYVNPLGIRTDRMSL